MKTVLISLILSLSVYNVFAQCNWTTVAYESYEYTTTIPYIVPGTVYQSTPQTYAGCVRTGARGMYMNIVNGYIGILYNHPYDNLCVGNEYRFTFSTRDAFSSTNNITIKIFDNNNVLLLSQNVINNNVWQDIVMAAFTATTSTVRFEIHTNIAGMSGNDVGFDDLRLQQCQPFPQNINLNQCYSSSAINLFDLITTPNLSTIGAWTGPSTLTGGYLGTYTPGTNVNGAYTYTIDGVGTCPDSTALITINLVSTPTINPIPTVEGCQTATLPAITGTNLSSPAYYTGVNGTGTSYQAGAAITSSQQLYAYSGLSGCFDEELVSIVINEPNTAGNDNYVSSCSALGVMDLNLYLTGTFSTGGTWSETSSTPSGQLNGSLLSSNNLTGGLYTFAYTVPANGACSSDQSVFTFLLSNDVTVDLGPDTTFCQGQSLTLSPGVYDSYLWDNNTTAATRTVSAPGNYFVKVGEQGGNLITNGDFELGNTGFTTSYNVGVGGSFGQLSNAGTYAINTSPNLVHTNFANCSDHTPAPGQNMMIVNGAGTPNTNVWCQTVAVQTNTDYQFSTWVMSALTDPNVAQLQFKINGSTLGSIFSPVSTSCIWNQFSQSWNSGIATTAQICIVNQNTTNSGNDFALDDIYFSSVCYATDTISISNHPNPVITASVNDTICQGETATITATSVTSNLNYTWNPGNIQNAVLNVSPATSTVYTVVATSAEGCTSNAISRIVIVKPSPLAEIEINGNDTLCYGGSVLLIANTSANSTVVWQPGGITTTMNNVSPLTDQIYTLTVTSANGCIKDTQALISVIPELEVNITGDNSICEEESTTFTASGNQVGMQYTWSPMNTSGNQVTVNASNVGWIYVEGNYFNCPSAIDSVDLILLPDPIVTPPTSVVVCPNEAVTAVASVDLPGSTIYWSPLNLEGTTQVITTSTPMEVFLVATNGNCVSDTVSFTISVNGACSLEVPNVFTPNNDTDNDYFQLISYDGIQQLECVIINRWGNVIRQFNQPDFVWDGTDESGDKVSQGTYFYKIYAVTSAKEEFKTTGFVELIR